MARSAEVSSLIGRHAVVTGAGRGIGRACAIALARIGAEVTVISRTESQLAETAAAIGEVGGRATVLKLDVTDGSAVAAALSDVPIDVLVNSAGVNIPMPFVDVTDDAYDSIMDLNVRATFRLCQHAARSMIARGVGGAIVNVTSQMAQVGGPNRSVYCASKAAVEGMTRALAVELGPRGIRVNCVAPTFIETALTAEFLAEPTFRKWALGEIPLGRFGEVDEVAAAVAFLASPAASLITGTSLLTDGGWTAH